MIKETYRDLFAELEEYENAGIRINLNEDQVSAMQIVTAHMVREEPSYMRDYVWDEEGKIQQLTFYDMHDN